MIGPNVEIGQGCKIQNNVSVYEGVTLEDDVFCGPSMVFTNVINPRANISRKDEFMSTHVGRGATIGANATIVLWQRSGRVVVCRRRQRGDRNCTGPRSGGGLTRRGVSVGCAFAAPV